MNAVLEMVDVNRLVSILMGATTVTAKVDIASMLIMLPAVVRHNYCNTYFWLFHSTILSRNVAHMYIYLHVCCASPDINECIEGTHNCSRTGNNFCINTIGSFICQCDEGYQHGNPQDACTGYKTSMFLNYIFYNFRY